MVRFRQASRSIRVSAGPSVPAAGGDGTGGVGLWIPLQAAHASPSTIGPDRCGDTTALR